MRPLVSWQWLLLIVGVVVLGLLLWPRPEKRPAERPISCERESLYVRVLKRERLIKDSLFRVLDTSPIPEEKRKAFSGLEYYEIRSEWCLRGRYEALPNAVLPVIGRLYLSLATLDSCRSPAILTVYGDAHGQNPYVAFWDSTAVVGETYEGGRYVPVFIEGDSAVIDFNRAYFPYCAYNPNYICLPYPPNNRFCGYIRAGERYGSRAPYS